MDCRNAERLIGAFIEDDLSTEDMGAFVDHVRNCESCMEELSIQYLVSEGMIRLEEGNTFDLQKELEARFERAARKMKVVQIGRRLLYILEMAAIFAVLIFLIMVVIL